MKKKIVNMLRMIKKYAFSIKTAVAAGIVLAAMLPLVIAGKVLAAGYVSDGLKKLEVEALAWGNMLAADISKQDYLENRSNATVEAQLEQIGYTYSGRVLVVASNYRVIRDTYIDQENKVLISAEVNRAFRGITVRRYNKEEENIEITMPIYGSDARTIKGVLILIIPDAKVRDAAEYIRILIARITDITFFVVMFAAVLTAWGISRPLHKLASVIKGITSGYMDTRLEQDKGFGEVWEVAAEVNKMLERLKTLDDSRQEFVSNVSHELKTPITSIKVLAESLNGQEDVPVELYKEFMEDIVEEIDRESQIINDLLSLVRMDKTAAELNITSQNMNELVEHVLKRLKPIAAEKNIELVLESFRPVVAEVDEVKISLVITNLVENAIKYNVANGWVRVSVNADHKYFYLTVADSGIGIPDESREMIFERFYRVDKARSRQSGGTGLGLAITKNAILMHRGAIRVYSKEGEGSTFTVRIPLTHTK